MVEMLEFITIPRRSGSEGDKKVRKYILEKLKESAAGISSEEGEQSSSVDSQRTEELQGCGLQVVTENLKSVFFSPSFEVIEQSFSFAADLNKIAYGIIAAVFVIILFFNMAFLLLSSEMPWYWLTLFSGIIVIAALIYGTRWNSLFELLLNRKNGKLIDTSNIIARFGKDGKKNIIFSAHRDSISEVTSNFHRVSLGMLAYASSWIVALYSIFSTTALIIGSAFINMYFLEMLQLNHIIAGLALFVMIVLTYFYFLESKNDSPGAHDNGSGVAVLYGLACELVKNPPEDVNVWLVFSSAEEEGLVGITKFLNAHEKELDKKNTYFVSLDCVGDETRLEVCSSYGFPPKNIAGNLASIALEAAKAEGVPAKKYWAPPGVGMEAFPAAYKGFKAINLTRMSLDNSLYLIHSRNDSYDRVSPKALEETLGVCKRIISSINNN